MSAITVTIGMLTEKGVTATETFWSEVPRWVWYVVAVSAVAWIARGETFQIRLPLFSFKAWLLFTTGFLLFMLLMSILPTWAATPFYFALVFLVVAIETLSHIGKENYEKLHKETQSGGGV
jgi:hypothetical protein